MEIYFNYSKTDKLSTQIINYNRRKTLVVPVIMLVEGVHTGSAGSVLYREKELSYDPPRWDGIPVMINHPVNERGEPIRARNPETILKSVGNIWNTEYNKEQKKLKAEAWIDIEKFNGVAPMLLQAIQSGLPVEVSTGLFFEMVEEPGIWNDEKYKGVAISYVPDHLALLSNTEGACSYRDGCGIRNEKNKIASANLTSFEYEDGGKKNMKRTKEQVDFLINCKHLEIADNKENRKWIEEEMSEEEYKALNIAAVKFNECDCNEKKSSDIEKKAIDVQKKLDQLVAMSKVIIGAGAGEEGKEKGKEEPIQNAQKEKVVPKTVEQFLDEVVPMQFKEVLTNSYSQHIQHKNELVSTLLKNEKNLFTKEQLETYDVANLEKLVELAGGDYNYSGAGGNQEHNEKYDPHKRREDGRGVPIPAAVNWKSK